MHCIEPEYEMYAKPLLVRSCNLSDHAMQCYSSYPCKDGQCINANSINIDCELSANMHYFNQQYCSLIFFKNVMPWDILDHIHSYCVIQEEPALGSSQHWLGQMAPRGVRGWRKPTQRLERWTPIQRLPTSSGELHKNIHRMHERNDQK